MAVREVFSGGELDSVLTVSGAPLVATTGYDAGYSACALNISNREYRCNFVGEDMASTTVPNTETLWVHFFGGVSEDVGGTLATVYDTTDRPCFRIQAVSGGYNVVVQWNSSVTSTPTWITAASFNNSSREITYIDASFAPNGAISLFFGDELKATGLASNIGGHKKYAIFGPSSTSFGQIGYVSQILVTENKSTVGARVWTRKATANGAVQEMDGTYTSLVKTAINDATAVISDTAGETATYVYQDVTTPQALEWGEVWLWSRGREDGASPTNLKGVARIGGTDYTTANAPGITGGYGPLPARFPTNPATSAKWNDAAFNGAELGMESAA